MSTDPTSSAFYDQGEGLPEQLPGSPFPLFQSWFDQAWDARETPNPNAMTLATTHEDGHPDARIVLCKAIEPQPGNIIFYTNYHGAKGLQLERSPFAAAVFHWDHSERQVRIRGPVTRASEEESDRYFQSRAIESRIGAWVSNQSQPIESRHALLEKVVQIMDQLEVSAGDLMEGNDVFIPRPPHWGGFRIHAQNVELWAGGVGRIHDRARWTRKVTMNDGQVSIGEWSATRLEP